MSIDDLVGDQGELALQILYSEDGTIEVENYALPIANGHSFVQTELRDVYLSAAIERAPVIKDEAKITLDSYLQTAFNERTLPTVHSFLSQLGEVEDEAMCPPLLAQVYNAEESVRRSYVESLDVSYSPHGLRCTCPKVTDHSNKTAEQLIMSRLDGSYFETAQSKPNKLSSEGTET